jgi:hypothetical protein
MCAFADWCTDAEQEVGDHSLAVLTAVAANLHVGRDAAAAIVPTHYASEERIADMLEKLGKSAAANYIRQKLPEGPRLRSGDLGEIFAAEYVAERMTYTVPIRRLRWRDHRNMAMRGDDIIAVELTEADPPLEFLKAEAKSYASLSRGAVTKARVALDKDYGLPSAHALSFVADRLRDVGNVELADAIDEAQLVRGIQPAEVGNMLFVFCGNDPADLLRDDLESYTGSICQSSVGLRVTTHQQFIKNVYDKVIADGDDG